MSTREKINEIMKMKKRITGLLLLLMIFTTGIAQKYTTANVNLRKGPGTEYGIISSLPRGTYVTIDDDCDCQWIPVSYSGEIGYISGKYLSNKRPSIVHKREGNRLSRSHRSIHYYTNVYGRRVQSPTRYSSRPAGATALCNDGTYSFSQSRRGTCSHHGGVSVWY